MIFTETPLRGAFVIDLQPRHDERGFFSRTYCSREFAERGLCTSWRQHNTSFSRETHTLRGMHYQVAPSAEVKLVRCVAGKIFDVIVDLREGSPTRFRWFGAELDASNRRSVYVPEGFAHGFLTLAPETEVIYQVSADYDPAAERGVRWNDPGLAISWPAPPAVISPRDAAFPDVTRAEPRP